MAPASPAKAYVYDAQVTGGTLSAAAATQASAPLVPRITSCYVDRHAVDPTVAGSVFLEAQVRPDGTVAGTSLYGQLADRPLLACLQGVLDGWTFPPSGAGADLTSVALPIVFRVEEPPPAKGKRR